MCFRERFEVFVLQMKKYGKVSGQISELNTAPVFPEILRSWYLLLKNVPSLSCAE